MWEGCATHPRRRRSIVSWHSFARAMPRLFGVDFGVPTRVSRVAVGVLFLGNAAVVAWYFAARWRGNPMRFFFDEHGVFRPMSMRDYLEFSLRVRRASPEAKH